MVGLASDLMVGLALLVTVVEVLAAKEHSRYVCGHQFFLFCIKKMFYLWPAIMRSFNFFEVVSDENTFVYLQPTD
jgi:hypothetical protein